MIASPQKEIELHRKRLASCSRAQLIAEIAQWKSFSAQHVAAKQLLYEMDRADSDKQHQETLGVAKSANRWAMYAFIVGLLSLIAVAGDWLYKHFRFSFHIRPKVEVTSPKLTPQSSTKDTVLPPIGQTIGPKNNQE
jgi:hypothetical protein